MSTLVTHHLLFTTEVIMPLEVDDHCGAALRGNFFEAVWRRFCTNKASPTCADCALHSVCPVSALVAPLREESPRGRDIPRPYVVLPPLGSARRYEPGEELLFGLTLFGNIVQFLPYIILSVDVLEAAGLGRKLKENNGKRGRFKTRKIESYNPFNRERQVLYEAGKPLVGVPTLSVTSEEVKARAAMLPTDSITIDFLTPTRLTEQKHLVHNALFCPLTHRLCERLTALEVAYGTEKGPITADKKHELVELAESVRCIDDTTQWEELRSYSHRQRCSTPIGSIRGKATFTGNITPFRELLTWGELIHIGKNAVKGNGWYKIEN